MIVRSRLRALFFIAAFLLPAIVSAATLDISPTSVRVSDGDAFTVTVYVSSPDQSLNAISGTLSFPTDVLSVSSVSKVSSLLTLWVQDPAFSNSDGSVSFSGVVPNPGWSGVSGRVVSVRFVAKKAGTANISFSSSAVLANDGNGTNISTAANPAFVSIVETATQQTVVAPLVNVQQAGLLAEITSSTHPDQQAWYAAKKVQFDWTNSNDAIAVRLGYGEKNTVSPRVVYQPPVSQKELSFEDGITYFAVQEKTSDGWGEIVRYRVQIDSVSPEVFSIQFVPQGNGSVSAIFSTTDALSGVDHYAVSINGQVPTVVDAAVAGNQYPLVVSTTGTSTLTVTAYDRAGNMSIAQSNFYALAPAITSPVSPAPYNAVVSISWSFINYLSILLIVGSVIAVVFFCLWYLWHRAHSARRVLLRQLAKTDTALHSELLELHKALKEEVERLKAEGTARELTSEEKRIYKRFSTLVKKTGKVITEEYLYT